MDYCAVYSLVVLEVILFF